jgi:hypothetical protein
LAGRKKCLILLSASNLSNLSNQNQNRYELLGSPFGAADRSVEVAFIKNLSKRADTLATSDKTSNSAGFARPA